jgi:pyruvate-formate lyase
MVNWQGYEDLRQVIVNYASKYANDDDYADGIGQQMLRFFLDRTKEYARRSYLKTLFPAAIGTFAWMKLIGSQGGATVDGWFACTAVTVQYVAFCWR